MSILPPPLISSLFPYTTLFRSDVLGVECGVIRRRTVAEVRVRDQAELLEEVERPVDRGEVHPAGGLLRSEEHTSELQSHSDLVCRLLLEKKKISVFKRCVCIRS